MKASEVKVGRVYYGVGQVTAIGNLFVETLEGTNHSVIIYPGAYEFEADEETGFEAIPHQRVNDDGTVTFFNHEN